MEQKKIRINDWSLINRSKNIKISKSLEGIDKALVGVIPKMFYHYETDKDSNIFIVIPVKYKDKVKEIIGKIVILGAPTTHLEYNEIADIIKREEILLRERRKNDKMGKKDRDDCRSQDVIFTVP